MTQTPEKLAQAQLDAYNARDLNAFMAVCTPDIELLSLATGEVIVSGHDATRETYRKLFDASPDLHCQLVSRITQGDFVIDQEHITGRLGAAPVDAIAIYEIQEELIRRAWFIY